jgi:hypothetical protein
MMEPDIESLYDLLLATLESMDTESDFEGSCPPLRECNMLHPSKDRVGPVEDDTYPIIEPSKL